VNFSWIQNTRTGKGRMNKAFKKICTACNVSCCFITDYTTSGIIGTIDGEIDKYNKSLAKFGVNELNPTGVNDKGKVVEWINPVVRGDAGTYDIIIFDEMKTLLDNSKEGENILLVLQPAMDYPPYIRKKLRNSVAIEYSHPVSIIGTTFPFKSINSIVATCGFLQRTFTLIRNLSIDEIRLMREAQVTLLNGNQEKEFEAMLKIFKSKVQKIKREGTLTLDASAKLQLGKINRYFLDKIQTTKGTTRESLLGFSNTLEEAALKMAGQQAVINNKNVILSSYISMSFDAVKIFIDTLIGGIDIKEDKDVENEYKKVIQLYKAYVTSNSNQLPDFVTLVNIIWKSGRLNKGNTACASLVRQMASSGYFIKVKVDKNKHLYKLNEQ
jgi:hypothetical protein